MASQGKGGYCRFCLNFQAAQVHHIIKKSTMNKLQPDLNLQRRLARLWAVCCSPLQFHTQCRQYVHARAQADGKKRLPPYKNLSSFTSWSFGKKGEDAPFEPRAIAASTRRSRLLNLP